MYCDLHVARSFTCDQVYDIGWLAVEVVFRSGEVYWEFMIEGCSYCIALFVSSIWQTKHLFVHGFLSFGRYF